MADTSEATQEAPPAEEQAPESFTKEDVDRLVDERVRAATSTAHKQLDLATKQLQAETAERERLESQLASASSVVETYKQTGKFEDAEEFAHWRAREEARIKEAEVALGKRAMEVTRAEIATDYGVPKETLIGARTEADMYRIALDFSRNNPLPGNQQRSPEPPAEGEQPPAPPPQPKMNRGGAGNPTPRSDAKGVEKIAEGLRSRPDFEQFFNSFN